MCVCVLCWGGLIHSRNDYIVNPSQIGGWDPATDAASLHPDLVSGVETFVLGRARKIDEIRRAAGVMIVITQSSIPHTMGRWLCGNRLEEGKALEVEFDKNADGNTYRTNDSSDLIPIHLRTCLPPVFSHSVLARDFG